MIRRFGCSRIEFLVAIAVIGLLTGLLLRTVERVRETAARTPRLKTLEQTGLVLPDRPDAQRQFPDGGNARRFSASAHLPSDREEDPPNESSH